MSFIKKLFKPIDLTKGTIWKNIIFFSLPILLSYIFQQIYTIADASICGQYLNANEVAGVNNTGNITFIVLQFAFGCTAGFSVITSKAVGCKDEEGIRKSLAMQIKLSFYVTIILTIIAIFSINPLLQLIGLTPSDNATQQEIYRSAYLYILVIFIGTFAQIFYNLICSFLRSVGDSLNPLLFLIFSTILNIALDILFITTFNWGVVGAAVATVIAQAISAIGCFTFTFIHYKEYRLHLNDFKIDVKSAFAHLKLGLPLAFQFSILAVGLIVMQGAIVKFDTSVDGVVIQSYAQNGFGAATKLNNFLMCPFSALGTAMLSYCGQNLGANETTRIKKGVTQAFIIMFIEYIIFAGIGLLLTINGAYMYIFYSPDKINEATIHFGNVYLYCDLSLYFILGALFILRNSLQGIGKALFPFLAGIGELTARTLICLILPTLLNGGEVNIYANNASLIGLSFADPLAWTFAVTTMLYGMIKYIYKAKEQNIEEQTKLN